MSLSEDLDLQIKEYMNEVYAAIQDEVYVCVYVLVHLMM